MDQTESVSEPSTTPTEAVPDTQPERKEEDLTIPEVATQLEEMKYDMEYPYVPLAAMAPAKYNPREMKDDALDGLTDSMKRYGLVQPLVWNKRTGNLVGGHQRYKILLRDGVKEAKTCVVDLDEKEEMALNIALNNPNIQGDFNVKQLSDVMKMLKSGLSAEQWKKRQLEALEKQLPMFDGVKETPNADEKAKRVPAAQAAEQQLAKADVKMVQIFMTTAQHAEFMQGVAICGEFCGTDNTSDTLQALVKGFVQKFSNEKPKDVSTDPSATAGGA